MEGYAKSLGLCVGEHVHNVLSLPGKIKKDKSKIKKKESCFSHAKIIHLEGFVCSSHFYGLQYYGA